MIYFFLSSRGLSPVISSIAAESQHSSPQKPWKQVKQRSESRLCTLNRQLLSLADF